ncbi:hypothetical protein Ccrd_005475 [Cynara cardunculus var. scolymus]|uniref:Uncharacterized protein n=1 Tax=Cynara cardunculus var. scolymus TaxID=59895 RepID=A0A103XKQ3_CYNCS|nr:hypothetical protein Ccrd_005475 [Cynara cardunculus var. scolymus]
MARVFRFEIFVTLLVLLSSDFITIARPLSILNTISCPDQNDGFFERFSLGAIKGGPSPGVGHMVTDKATVGGIKAKHSQGVQQGFTSGGVKDDVGHGIGHKFINIESLGGLKNSGPSPGAGH